MEKLAVGQSQGGWWLWVMSVRQRKARAGYPYSRVSQAPREVPMTPVTFCPSSGPARPDQVLCSGRAEGEIRVTQGVIAVAGSKRLLLVMILPGEEGRLAAWEPGFARRPATARRVLGGRSARPSFGGLGTTGLVLALERPGLVQ